MVKFYVFKKIGNLSDLPNLLDVRWTNTSDVVAHAVLPCGGTFCCGFEVKATNKGKAIAGS
jgi:hypothetical protein